MSHVTNIHIDSGNEQCMWQNDNKKLIRRWDTRT